MPLVERFYFHTQGVLQNGKVTGWGKSQKDATDNLSKPNIKEAVDV
jgi:hypothetical protein